MDRVYFAPDGTFLHSRDDRHAGPAEAVGGRRGAVRGRTVDGRWDPVRSHLSLGPEPRPFPARTALPTADDAGSRVRGSRGLDTLGDYGGIQQRYVYVGGTWKPTSIVPPFASDASWALGAADGTIVVGDDASPQVDRPDGTRSIVRWEAEPEAITDADVDAWRGPAAKRLVDTGTVAGAGAGLGGHGRSGNEGVLRAGCSPARTEPCGSPSRSSLHKDHRHRPPGGSYGACGSVEASREPSAQGSARPLALAGLVAVTPVWQKMRVISAHAATGRPPRSAG